MWDHIRIINVKYESNSVDWDANLFAMIGICQTAKTGNPDVFDYTWDKNGTFILCFKDIIYESLNKIVNESMMICDIVLNS